ncbi:MAG: stage III sporulation protein AE [Tissierellia bacterium]|nr:stage III sporulation protein AE [Tissierellia bacterium]
MLKNKKLLIITILLVFIPSLYSFAEEVEEGDIKITDKFIEEQLDSLNIKELELVLEDIVKGNEFYFPKIDIKETILSMIKGKDTFSIENVGKGLASIIFREILGNLNLISHILVIAVASGVLTNLQNAFERDTVTKLAHYATYIILSMLMINSFTLALELGKKTVDQMVNFMQILLPILLTLLTAVGGPNTRLIFHPLIIGIVNVIGSLIKGIVFPLIFFSFIIGVISNISQKVQFSKLSELMRQVIIVLVSASFTVFIGIITIYGLGANVDGVTIRTAKFAVDSFVPIIGKFLSDAVEAVVGFSAILKNGIGMVGLIALFLICVAPAIKITVLIFIYKTIAALIEPITSINASTCFNEVAKGLVLILVGLLSVATMFFITITIIVGAGNTSLMFR